MGRARHRPLISIVIPTLTVRRHWLSKCLQAYQDTIPSEVAAEYIVIGDKPACGIAWNEGLGMAKGSFIHLTADDITPLPGWCEAGIASVKRDELPAARILNADGSLQNCGTDDQEHPDGEEAFVARIPFATAEQFEMIGPMMNEQYMGDYWFSHRGRQVGLKSIVNRAYSFVHHYAREGRIDTLKADEQTYYQRGGAKRL